MAIEESFPHGADSYLGSSWILHAIDNGSMTAIEWMLTQHIDLNIRDQDGGTVLHSVLDREGIDRYELLEMMLIAGADVNVKGINDWTPSHKAAVNNDVKALEILVKNGADLSIRTSIDEYATPLEEAMIMNKYRACSEAIKYLQSVDSQSS